MPLHISHLNPIKTNTLFIATLFNDVSSTNEHNS